MTVDALRTPDDRFADLPGYPFEPHYAEIPDGEGGTLRVHHLDEGDPSAPVVLLLHGEPSWSYLYRHMIPVLVDAGLRAVAPDLVGFGRSDKPAKRTDYTYARHVAWLSSHVFDALDLRDITLVCQDWGGLLGLRLVTAQPDRFAAVVAANTFLPTGDGKPGDAFLAWQKFSQEVPEMPIGRIVSGGCTTDLSDDVIAAYDAPFPDETYKEGARQFPTLVPTSPEDPEAPANRAAWEVLAAFDRPFLCAFSDEDKITAGNERHLISRIAGAQGQPHTTITGGGHFLQEDRGPQLAQVVDRPHRPPLIPRNPYEPGKGDLRTRPFGSIAWAVRLYSLPPSRDHADPLDVAEHGAHEDAGTTCRPRTLLAAMARHLTETVELVGHRRQGALAARPAARSPRARARQPRPIDVRVRPPRRPPADDGVRHRGRRIRARLAREPARPAAARRRHLAHLRDRGHQQRRRPGPRRASS